MKRVLAFALVLAVFSPVAMLIVSACAADPCCAAEGDRVAALLPCCAPAICPASPSPHQVEVTGASAQVGLPAHGEEADTTGLASRSATHAFQANISHPPPTRIRLALVATLLI